MLVVITAFATGQWLFGVLGLFLTVAVILLTLDGDDDDDTE